MSTIYQCDKCGAQSSDPGSIAKVDLVDLCKTCRMSWSLIKSQRMTEFLGTPEQATKKTKGKRIQEINEVV